MQGGQGEAGGSGGGVNVGVSPVHGAAEGCSRCRWRREAISSSPTPCGFFGKGKGREETEDEDDEGSDAGMDRNTFASPMAEMHWKSPNLEFGQTYAYKSMSVASILCIVCGCENDKKAPSLHA